MQATQAAAVLLLLCGRRGHAAAAAGVVGGGAAPAILSSNPLSGLPRLQLPHYSWPFPEAGNLNRSQTLLLDAGILHTFLLKTPTNVRAGSVCWGGKGMGKGGGGYA